MRPQRESEGPRDWLYYVAVGALVLALANVSTVRGYLSEPPAHEFIGTSSIYYPDLFYHLSFATQVARGEPLLEQKYNGNQVQTRLLINLPAMVIGSLMWLGLSGEAVYIAVRNLVGCCLLFMIYLLCRRVLLGRATRLIAFTVAAVGSGLSWIPNLVGYFWINPKGQPYDIWAKFSPVWGMLLETWPDAHVLELSTIWLIFFRSTAMPP